MAELRYYLVVDLKPAGPFSCSELMSRADFGGDSVVCVVGATSADAWHRAADDPELSRRLAARSAPAPAISLVAPEPIALSAPAPRSAPTAAQPESAAQAAVAAAEPAAAQAPPQPVPASERLVLIVEDDPDFRALLEASVHKEGFQVIAAEDGRDAGQRLESHEPNLVITDLMMPNAGGYEFLRSLQGAGQGSVPVFLVTGAVLDTSTISVMRQDANIVQVFAKPVKISVLVQSIHQRLNTRRVPPTTPAP